MEGATTVSARATPPAKQRTGAGLVCENDKLNIGLPRYWEYLGILSLALLAIQTFLQPTASSSYNQLIGYVGLAIEAILPLPQMLANQRAQSCKGFRVSVLGNWLFGDTMKMGFFFISEPGKVPWAFKMCGIFQAFCDAGLGVQYCVYGNGEDGRDKRDGIEKDGRLG